MPCLAPARKTSCDCSVGRNPVCSVGPRSRLFGGAPAPPSVQFAEMSKSAPTPPLDAIALLGRLARARLEPAARFLFLSLALATLVAAGFIARRGSLEARGAAASIVIGLVLGYGARWRLWRGDVRRSDRLVRRVVLEADRSLGERVLRGLALD